MLPGYIPLDYEGMFDMEVHPVALYTLRFSITT